MCGNNKAHTHCQLGAGSCNHTLTIVTNSATFLRLPQVCRCRPKTKSQGFSTLDTVGFVLRWHESTTRDIRADVAASTSPDRSTPIAGQNPHPTTFTTTQTGPGRGSGPNPCLVVFERSSGSTDNPNVTQQLPTSYETPPTQRRAFNQIYSYVWKVAGNPSMPYHIEVGYEPILANFLNSLPLPESTPPRFRF